MSPADTFPDPGTKVGQPRDSQSAVRTNTMPLWTQLLQRNTPALGLAPGGGGNVKSLPPIAPVDKAGTSMRILLHDTQAQFEKFSERVVKLTDGVEGAKREVTTMQKLFEREHEHLMEEVVDLGMFNCIPGYMLCPGILRAPWTPCSCGFIVYISEQVSDPDTEVYRASGSGLSLG